MADRPSRIAIIGDEDGEVARALSAVYGLQDIEFYSISSRIEVEENPPPNLITLKKKTDTKRGPRKIRSGKKRRGKDWQD